MCMHMYRCLCRCACSNRKKVQDLQQPPSVVPLLQLRGWRGVGGGSWCSEMEMGMSSLLPIRAKKIMLREQHVHAVTQTHDAKIILILQH